MIRILGRGESFKKPTKLGLLILSASSERLKVVARLPGAVSCRTRPELGCGVVVMVVLRAFLAVSVRSRPELGCVVVSQGNYAAPSQAGRLKLVISR